MEVRAGGFRDVIENLHRVSPALGAQVYGAGLRAAARVAASQAKTLVPVAEGLLQRSIGSRSRSSRVYTTRGPRKIGGSAAQVFAGTDRPGTAGEANHAVLVEYGTVHATAQPYLAPAIDETEAEQFAAAAQAMRAAYVRLAASVAAGPSERTRRLAAL